MTSGSSAPDLYADLRRFCGHILIVKAELNSTKQHKIYYLLHVSVLRILMEYTTFVILKILCLLVTIKTVFYIDFVVESVRLFLQFAGFI